MINQSLNGVLEYIRKVAAVHTYSGLSDGELLERFVKGHDEAAFAVLIERHGPMVLGICRRTLSNFHDAEDACQATFLVLARKAASVRKTSLSSWLHAVACRVAATLKRSQARRKARELGIKVPAPKDPAAEVSLREVQTILDEELQQLPERYRAPLILCYLECLTRDEAARRLGLSAAALHGRLERGRALLRKGLTKRGLTLAGTMLSAALGESLANAALPPTFVVSSTKAAMVLAAGQPLTESVLATKVITLTQEVLKSMFLTKLKVGTATLCACLIVAIIGGSFTSSGIAQDKKPEPPAEKKLGSSRQQESDTDFMRRMSKDLRGTEPTPAEIHFFVTSKEAGKRQKLIDLFIQERQAKQAKQAKTGMNPMMGGMNPMMGGMMGNNPMMGGMGGMNPMMGGMMGNNPMMGGMGGMNPMMGGMMGNNPMMGGMMGMNPMMGGMNPQNSPAQRDGQESLGMLQREFYKKLQTAKDKADVANITQAYLDQLVHFVKSHAKSQELPDFMRQIVLIYESQDKLVEAGAWRGKLMKEFPNEKLKNEPRKPVPAPAPPRTPAPAPKPGATLMEASAKLATEPIGPGGKATIEVTVKGLIPSAGAPTGCVTVSVDEGLACAPVALTPGPDATSTATLTIHAPGDAWRSYTLTAMYFPTGIFQPSSCTAPLPVLGSPFLPGVVTQPPRQ